jgi:hypothetical protein
LARELRDVLDFFLPGAGEGVEPAGGPRRPLSRPERPAALDIVALPIGEGDVVRAAFAWNLAVEVARLGARAALLAPAADGPSPLWPSAGRGPLGAELLFTRVGGLEELHHAALDLAVTRAAEGGEGGLVLVRVPPAWLLRDPDGRGLLRWSLLFTSVEPRELMETYGLTKSILARSAEARVGVTVHGARRRVEAERAFSHLADVSRRHLHRSPLSYGLLVDDLHVYRAIVARRPIGLERPQSPAARALRDVARLLLADAGGGVHA